MSDDGQTLLTSHNNVGKVYKKNVGTGDYENPQMLTSDSVASYGCISGDGEFVGIGGNTKFRVLRLNSSTNLYD